MENQLDIVGDNPIPINQEFVTILTKANCENINKGKRWNCKILKFSNDWNFDEILLQISKLDSNLYPNLFIFIIESKNIEDHEIKILKNFLRNFSTNRSMILQISSKDAKIFYKDGNCGEFFDIKVNKVEDFNDFQTFLGLYFNEKVNNFQDLMLEKLPKVQNSSLILKFLVILELSQDFFDDLVLKVAINGTKSDILAAIDAFLDDKGNIQGLDLLNFIPFRINSTSILHTAVINSNKEIIDILIQKCTHLIQRIMFEHQVEISTAAFASNKLEVLCDLLEFSDFPFPNDFIEESVTDERLCKIIKDRNALQNIILAENLVEIEKFIQNHPNIKFGFNVKNVSALAQALYSKKFEAFFRLKSFGFVDNEIDSYQEKIEEVEEKAKANKFARIQRVENVKKSIADENAVVMQLATKSLIFRRHKNSATEEKQRNKIIEWYGQIYKTKFGSKLFDAAAQCDELKIIFDFEYYSVQNVDVSQSSGSLGTTYPISKFIFIGAKYSDEEKHEQRIKGVIAHEICHFVMRLVYQNNENPYYIGDDKASKKFDEVVGEVEQILFPPKEQKQLAEIEEKGVEPEEEIKGRNEAQLEVEGNDESEENADSEEKEESEENAQEEVPKIIDDGCSGVILTVYTLYDKKDRHPELIVRPAHILAQFDDDEDKTKELEEKYKILFEFFELFVIPELKKFNLEQRRSVQDFNNYVGLLSEVQDLKLEFLTAKNLTDLLDNQLIIVTTNVPKLFLINIFKILNEKYGNVLDVQNIFMTTAVLKNSHVSKNLQGILTEVSNLNIFAYCLKEFENIFELVASNKSNFFLIISNEKDCEHLSSKFKDKHLIPSKMTVNYTWMNLTVESQNLLLQTKVNFQNNSSFTLHEIISNENQMTEGDGDLMAIIDDQMLNMMVEKSPIQTNEQSLDEFGDTKFRILFQSRYLIKNYQIFENSTKFDKANSKIINKSEAMSQEQMLEDAKNEKFVLISDKAGSGKSWILKNFANKLRQKCPKKWITYVDLKLLINEFKSQTSALDFPAFIVDKILKPKFKFEAEIFKKLYKNGQVCIFFDGFDEVAPDCAEFVTKLFQSFNQNGGNQLWIATRDYFEVNLKEELKIDAAYSIDEFTLIHGINLIASSWVLSENDCQSESDVKNSPNYYNYKEMAENLSHKIKKSQATSIGLPQFYKMVADITKDNKNSAINFTMTEVFEECANIQYERWSKEKGELRAKANTESQKKDINFHKLHQIIAMESLFPEDSSFCDLDIEDLDWSDEEIIACGLLSKKGEKFFFPHETFREFYAAEFVIRILQKKKLDGDLCGYLIKFLTVKKFRIVRMFLNEYFGKNSMLKKIEQKIPKIAEYFCKNADEMENLHQIFDENLEHLVELLLRIFQAGNFEHTHKILLLNKKIIASAATCAYLFIKTQNFIINYLHKDALKAFLYNNEIFVSIFDSVLHTKVIENFLCEVKNKIGLEFISQALKMKDDEEEHLIFYLVRSKNVDGLKLQEIFQILQEFLNLSEIKDLVRAYNKNGINILHICLHLQAGSKLKFLWTKLQQIYSPQQFRNLLYQKSDSNLNILHIAAKCEIIEFHETLWELMLNTFTFREDLKIFVMQTDEIGVNYLHFLLIYNNANVIELTFKKLKDNLSKIQFKVILRSKGLLGGNLLQTSVCKSKNTKTHKILWKIFRDSCESNEFMEIVKEVDSQYNNIFHVAACSSTKEIFQFMIDELEQFTSREEIVKILSTLGCFGNHLLQTAAMHNKSFEFQQNLWKIVQKFFLPSEIVEMIKHTNMYGNNLLLCAVERNAKEIVELTCNEVKCALNDAELTNLLQQVNFSGRNLLQMAACWSKDVEVHKILWKILRESCDSVEDFLKFFKEVDKNGDNFLHLVAYFTTSEIFELGIEELEKVTSTEEIKKMLTTFGAYEGNLIHSATATNKSLEIHIKIWQVFGKYFNFAEILQFINHCDRDGDNIFHNGVFWNTKEIVEHTWKQIERLRSTKDDRIEYLNRKGHKEQNLLELSLENQAKDPEVHTYVENLMNEYGIDFK